MNKFKLTMKASHLRQLLAAHLVTASKDTTRPHLNCVAFACKSPVVVELCSTNGHFLLRSSITVDHCNAVESEPVIMPAHIAKAFITTLKPWTEKADCVAELSLVDSHWCLTTLTGVSTFAAPSDDDDTRFTPYEQFIPNYHAEDGRACRAIGLDIDYMRALDKAIVKDTSSKTSARPSRFSFGGELDPIRVDSEIPSMGLTQTFVLMPMRI